MKTSYKSTRHDLMSVPLPTETKTYKPVSHTELIGLTEASIAAAGFEIASVEYSMAKDGNVANAIYVLKSSASDPDMALMIAWQNSYDKSLTLKFAIGAQVFICANGCVSGTLGSFKRKHTGEIQTFAPQAITDYIKRSVTTFDNLKLEKDLMSSIPIDKRQTAELIGRLIIEENLITPTQMNTIRRQLTHPTYEYGAPGSLWELYQFTTFALKDCHPSLWMDTHLAVHDFFVNASFTIIPFEEKVTEAEESQDLFPIKGEETVNQLTIFDAIKEAKETQEFIEVPLEATPEDGGEEAPVEEFILPIKVEEPDNITVDPDGNYLVNILSEDLEGADKEFHLTLYADDEESAETLAMAVFEFDHPLRPVQYVTINKIK